MSSFERRLSALPYLGMGVSTEYGAMRAPGSLEIMQARQELPQCVELLELGVETAKGLDQDARDWIGEGLPTTYHFLDINLDDPADFDKGWIEQVCNLITEVEPAWLCGDAGMWHHGPRQEGHMLLLPPILTRDSAYALADGIIRLREETGCEVLPENPPGQIFIGPLHLLDFFAIVLERADTGMLLDAAHLVIYQDALGLPVTSGLDDFPLERVIELHMAGGVHRTYQGLDYIEDDHNPMILPETWEVFRWCAPQFTELRAVIFECERNSLMQCREEMTRLRSALDKHLPAQSIWHSRSSEHL